MRLIVVVLTTLTLEWQGLVLEDLTYYCLVLYGFLFDYNDLNKKIDK